MRMLEVSRVLRQAGEEVEFSSSGEVAEMLSRMGFSCNPLPLADVRYSEDGSFLVRDTLLASPWILGRTYRQVRLEVSNIERFGADVVLSDSALPTVIAARALRVPALTVLNQLNLSSSHGKRSPLSALLSVGISAGMGRLWELSREVLLPDLPPPYTISERNLWGSKVEKTRYVGFLSTPEDREPDDALPVFEEDPRPKVFWQVSGPPRTRSSLLAMALEFSEKLKDDYAFVVSGGDPLSTGVPVKIPGGWYYGWCQVTDHYFRSCDFVISRAGHGTIGQAICASKPSILVPIPRQPEQEANADKAVRLGVSISIQQHALTLETLSKAMRTILDDGFSRRAEQLGSYARSFDARAEVVRSVGAAARQGHRGPH